MTGIKSLHRHICHAVISREKHFVLIYQNMRLVLMYASLWLCPLFMAECRDSVAMCRCPVAVPQILRPLRLVSAASFRILAATVPTLLPT